MANTSINLTSLDFDQLKNLFKTYLSGQDIFKDYDFDGSNISVLLDLMAYNTYQNAFYLNMVASEMFLDSAQLRDSVVSHAKELNYVPRSRNAAYANVDIIMTPSVFDESVSKVIIPKGTSFTARDNDRTLTFTIDQNIIAERQNNSYVAPSVTLYEGTYVTETFTVNKDEQTRYILQNPNIDIRDINVIVIEDSGAKYITYKRAFTLFGLSSTAPVFFVQPSFDGKYEVIFGDDIIARSPKNNSVVVIEYRITAGEFGNRLREFKPNGPIAGISNIKILTNTPASGGADAESLQSIKYNAPRHFNTQERAVTAEDYETLLRINYPEINGVSAFGGDEANPPQYGKVFISVDLKDVDGLPSNKKIEYTKFIKSRSALSIDPVFIEPDYLYLYVKSRVRYNVNITTLTSEDIRTFVTGSILNYNNSNLNNFKRTLRYSQLVKDIDEAHFSIVSNQTEVKAMKKFVPILNRPQTFDIDFGIQLDDNIPPHETRHAVQDLHIVESTPFIWENQRCILGDNGSGDMVIAALNGDEHVMLRVVGSVNYETGLVQISNFNISSYEGDSIKIYATTLDKDITATKGSIISILEDDVDISVEIIRE